MTCIFVIGIDFIVLDVIYNKTFFDLKTHVVCVFFYIKPELIFQFCFELGMLSACLHLYTTPVFFVYYLYSSMISFSSIVLNSTNATHMSVSYLGQTKMNYSSSNEPTESK